MQNHTPPFIQSPYLGEYVFGDGSYGRGYYLQSPSHPVHHYPPEPPQIHHQPQAFYPSPHFAGHYPGYVFKTDVHGVGYYLDR